MGPKVGGRQSADVTEQKTTVKDKGLRLQGVWVIEVCNKTSGRPAGTWLAERHKTAIFLLSEKTEESL
ncbi:hypothetical protein SRHO_G00197820 [Serrasalmus rhombeus]